MAGSGRDMADGDGGRGGAAGGPAGGGGGPHGAGGGRGGRESGFRPLRMEDPDELAGFRLVARLGSGGMGTVYLSHMPDGEPTALKVIRPELAEAPDFQRQFEREIRAARRVRGRFTVPVLQSDVEGPVPWLATSYVAGPSLGEAVGAHGPLPEATAVRLIAGVAEALRDIHAAGVVHRDLKPSNVLLAADGPRVIDFGIARAADATATWTEGARRVGTPGFMAPEQVRADEPGEGVTARADMFALGLLACFAATGTGAFGRGKPEALLYRIVHDEPELSEVPVTLRDIVAACLAKDPSRRPGPDQVLSMCAVAAAGSSPLPEPGWLPDALERETALRAAPPPGAPGAEAEQQPSAPEWLTAGPLAGSGDGTAPAAAPYRGGFGPVIIRSESGPGAGGVEGDTPSTLAAGPPVPSAGGPTPPGAVPPGPPSGAVPGPPPGPAPSGGVPPAPHGAGPGPGPQGAPGPRDGADEAAGAGVPGFGPPVAPPPGGPAPGEAAPVAGGPTPTWMEQQLAAAARPSAGHGADRPRRKRAALGAALAVVLVLAMVAGGSYAFGLFGGGSGDDTKNVSDLASGRPDASDEEDDDKAHAPGVIDPDETPEDDGASGAEESLVPAEPEEKEEAGTEEPGRDDPAPSTTPSPTPSRSTEKPPATTGPTPTPTRSSPSIRPPAPGQPGRDNCSYPSGGEWSEGMAGEPVKQIQCLLNHNYDERLDVDGIFGPKTTAAVRSMQSCSGIAVDGIVGPDTWRYLKTPKRACGN